MEKTLDQKLRDIHANPSTSKAFILADAKDADMAFGIGATGNSTEPGQSRFKTLAEYREQIRQVIKQGLVDIMLMSASTVAQIAIEERMFENSPTTPAGRANDASDVFVVRGANYITQPAQPYRSALLDHLQCGHIDCTLQERSRGANLGLYSVTFNNRLEDDLYTLNQYKAFREEAERKGFKHFLEVFAPNAPHNLNPADIPNFINDHIARTLAGVAPSGRPVFLKIPYQGPKATEDLVRYDPHLVVGILGGGAGTTYDAFKMLAEAKKYGARAALYGRKINFAENQLAFIEFLRMIADDQITPEEAVKAYHGVLQKLKIKPQRSLAEDMELRNTVMSYAGSGSSSQIVVPTLPKTTAEVQAKHAVSTKSASAHEACPCGGPSPKECECTDHDKGHNKSASAISAGKNPDTPDFKRMTPAEKLAWNKANRDRIFGKI